MRSAALYGRCRPTRPLRHRRDADPLDKRRSEGSRPTAVGPSMRAGLVKWPRSGLLHVRVGTQRSSPRQRRSERPAQEGARGGGRGGRRWSYQRSRCTPATIAASTLVSWRLLSRRNRSAPPHLLSVSMRRIETPETASKKPWRRGPPSSVGSRREPGPTTGPLHQLEWSRLALLITRPSV